MKTYNKTEWVDHIVDLENDEIIQQGTRFTAARANNIEDGIANLYGSQSEQDDEIRRMKVQIEMIGRTPINNGTFYDTLSSDEPKNLTLQTVTSISQGALVVGNTVISLDDSSKFSIGQEVTVFDDTSQENVMVKAVDVTNKRITVAALTKAFKKGAKVSPSNSIANRVTQKIGFGEWGTYTIAVSEVV